MSSRVRILRIVTGVVNSTGGRGGAPSDTPLPPVLRVHRRLLLQQLHVRPAEHALLVRQGEPAWGPGWGGATEAARGRGRDRGRVLGMEPAFSVGPGGGQRELTGRQRWPSLNLAWREPRREGLPRPVSETRALPGFGLGSSGCPGMERAHRPGVEATGTESTLQPRGRQECRPNRRLRCRRQGWRDSGLLVFPAKPGRAERGQVLNCSEQPLELAGPRTRLHSLGSAQRLCCVLGVGQKSGDRSLGSWGFAEWQVVLAGGSRLEAAEQESRGPRADGLREAERG